MGDYNLKQIFENIYIKVFRFASLLELSKFANNQGTKNCLFLDDTFSDIYYCYVGYHSLTREKQFVLCFGSDVDENNLNFLCWQKLLVLDTAKNIYLIKKDLKVKASIEITTPLVGLYVISDERILVLEEAYMRVINREGETLQSKLFDLMEDFSIKNNFLSIQTVEGIEVVNLLE